MHGRRQWECWIYLEGERRHLMGLRWTSVIWSVKWVFYYSVLLNQVNLSIDIGESWQCNVIKVVPSTEINFWYFIVSSKPIFIFYNTNQLDLGFTKFWRFHFLLNPVHVVWNTGKYRKYPSFCTTTNSNQSVLRPSLDSQRTSRVALRKQKSHWSDLKRYCALIGWIYMINSVFFLTTICCEESCRDIPGISRDLEIYTQKDVGRFAVFCFSPTWTEKDLPD